MVAVDELVLKSAAICFSEIVRKATDDIYTAEEALLSEGGDRDVAYSAAKDAADALAKAASFVEGDHRQSLAFRTENLRRALALWDSDPEQARQLVLDTAGWIESLWKKEDE